VVPDPPQKPTADTNKQCVYLFSSNIRPLYEQDILNVLAAPIGTRYSFRYEGNYVQEDLRRIWGPELQGVSALVLFSLQQLARYHDPVVFPVRQAIVEQAQVLGGSIYLVDFVLDRIVALSKPSDNTSDSFRFRTPAGQFMKTLSDRLGQAKVPYQAAASIGPDLRQDAELPMDSTSDEIELLDRNGQFLSRTDSFATSWFLHVAGLSRERNADMETARRSLLDEPSRSYRLQGGQTYHLQIIHRQPKDVVEQCSFNVEADEESLRIIGRRGFTIGSRYDRILIPVHAVAPSDGQTRQSFIAIEPERVRGPSIRVPVTVTPSTGTAAAAIGTGFALFLLAIGSFDENASTTSKILFLGGALLAYVAGQLWRFTGALRQRHPRKLASTRIWFR
jgi:hypothetical protein